VTSVNFKGLGRKRSWFISRYYPIIRLEWLREIMKILSHDSLYHSPDSNWESPEYKSGSLQLESTCLLGLIKEALFLLYICFVPQQLKHRTKFFFLVLHKFNSSHLGVCPEGDRTLALLCETILTCELYVGLKEGPQHQSGTNASICLHGLGHFSSHSYGYLNSKEC
jgi:hypothetical protein